MCAALHVSVPLVRRHPPRAQPNSMSPRPAECNQFQPAACLGRLERDQHGLHVLCTQYRLPPHRMINATCYARSISPPAFHRALPCSAVCTRFQPAACLGCLEHDQHGVHVLCAQRCLPLHRLPDATPATPRATRATRATNTAHAFSPPLAWQWAQGFNQPLTWDVSSVTSMDGVFEVRSATCLCTPLA